MSGPTLPSGWRLKPIRDTVVPSGSRNPKKEGIGSFRYVDVDALDNTRQVIGSAKEVAKSDAPSRARMLIKQGDVLFCLVRPYLKNIAVVPHELDGEVASTAYCVLRPIAGMDSRFLFYQIVRESFIHSIPTYGNSPPSARDDEFMGMSLYVAPLPEQRRIVAKIEELFSDLDAGVAALERVRANLKRYRAAVLKAAVEGRLTEEWRTRHPATEPAAKLLERILAERRAKWDQDQLRKFKEAGKPPPKGWRERYNAPTPPELQDARDTPKTWAWASVEQLAAEERYSLAIGPFGSNLKVSDYEESGVPLIFVRNIRANDFGGARDKFVSPAKAAELVAHSADPGDILITKMGDPPGDACLYPAGRSHAIITADCIKWRLHPLLPLPQHFVNAVNSEVVKRQMGRITKGVAQQKVSLERFGTVAVPLPPRAEQAEIVAEVDRRLSVADAAETQVEHALQRAARLRQAILKRAFEGKLVPQDPTDEPAAALLERIKAGGSNGHRVAIDNKDGSPTKPAKRRSRARV